MANFTQRHRMFKAGVVLVLLSLPIAIAGLVAPGWLTSSGIQTLTGAVYWLWWWSCTDGFSTCYVIDLSEEPFFPGRFYASLGLNCAGVFLLCLTTLLTVNREFCQSTPSTGRLPGIGAVIAGVKLFAACMIFVSFKSSLFDPLDVGSNHYGPSFILTLVASVASGMGGAFMMAYGRAPPSGQFAFQNFGYAPTTIQNSGYSLSSVHNTNAAVYNNGPPPPKY